MPRAVAREYAHVRPPADQGEHAVTSGRVPDGPDAFVVDTGAELGVAKKPIQHRAQLARAPAPVLRGAAIAVVAKTVAGVLRRGHDIAALGKADRSLAVIEAAAAAPVR